MFLETQTFSTGKIDKEDFQMEVANKKKGD